ncbi:uncharacterized protein KD926_002779 [Aspergillus affinis]|uniref:uncharacterized protein n=1 Tax=Aspergillus affinis TaxID=1070780 RepID=UPI0022FE8B4A|nr:uncharacterized protein KD926_002779 [Aspergillus affinis]KAI9043888.1 hypothetical protein KD926_002779 [Aspergillus affinis]
MVFPRILTSFSRSYSGSGSVFKQPVPDSERRDEDRPSPSSSTSTIQPLKRSEESEDVTPTNAYTPRGRPASAKLEDKKAEKASSNDGGWSYGLESDNSDISTLDLGPSVTISTPTPEATTPLATHPEYPFTPLPRSESQGDPFDQISSPERQPDSPVVYKTEESDQRANDVPAPQEKGPAKTPARPPKRKSDTVVATFRTLSSSGSSLFAGLRPGVNRARTSFRRGGALSD